jgi:hypothetical protein
MGAGLPNLVNDISPHASESAWNNSTGLIGFETLTCSPKLPSL